MSQCLGTGNDQTLFQFDEPGVAYREGGFAGYRETEAAGPCRAAGGTLAAGSENIVVRPCWWDGGSVAPTLTTRSLGQRMPDEGQLPCVIDSLKGEENSTGDCDKPVVEEAYGAALDIHMGCPVAKEVSQTLKVSTAPGYNTAVAVVPKVYGISPKDSNGMKSANPNSGFPELHVAKTLDTLNPDPSKAQGGIAIVVPSPVAIPIDTMNASERPSNKSPKCGIGEDGDPAPTLSKGHHHAVCIALDGDKIAKAERKGGSGLGVSEDGAMYTETAKDVHAVCTEEAGIVRRLLPVECERLMGFPDGYTRIAWKGKPPEECPDSPRYKACGNSMCVNVMAWVGHRIQENEEKHTCPQTSSG